MTQSALLFMTGSSGAGRTTRSVRWTACLNARCLSTLLLVSGLPAALWAQTSAPVAARTQALRCSPADSALGSKAAGSTAAFYAGYLPDKDQSILFTKLTGPISNAVGIRGATGLVRLPGHGPLREPRLEVTLRIFGEAERIAGTQFLQLAADDSVVGDSLPLALRRQGASNTRRVLQTATAPLTPAQTLALTRAKRISGTLSGAHFDLTDDERDGLRALVTAAICGTRDSW